MNGTIGVCIGFGGNFAPRTWAFCSGQLLAISSNTALFSIIGTTYGGDGRTTMALPDLRGRSPISAGTGPGLSTYKEGARGGVEEVTLNVTQIPSHNHVAAPQYGPAGQLEPAGNRPSDFGQPIYGAAHGGNMGAADVANTGGSQAHNNMMPWEAIYWIICMVGVYPSRS